MLQCWPRKFRLRARKLCCTGRTQRKALSSEEALRQTAVAKRQVCPSLGREGVPVVSLFRGRARNYRRGAGRSVDLRPPILAGLCGAHQCFLHPHDLVIVEPCLATSVSLQAPVLHSHLLVHFEGMVCGVKWPLQRCFGGAECWGAKELQTIGARRRSRSRSPLPELQPEVTDTDKELISSVSPCQNPPAFYLCRTLCDNLAEAHHRRCL